MKYIFISILSMVLLTSCEKAMDFLKQDPTPILVEDRDTYKVSYTTETGIKGVSLEYVVSGRLPIQTAGDSTEMLFTYGNVRAFEKVSEARINWDASKRIFKVMVDSVELVQPEDTIPSVNLVYRDWSGERSIFTRECLLPSDLREGDNFLPNADPLKSARILKLKK